MNINHNLKDELTRWTVTPSGFGGYNFGTPQTMKCRWEERQVLYRDPQGVERVSGAVVYCEEDIAIEDYVYHGTSVVLDPTTIPETFQVKQFNKVTDLRNVTTLRKAFL